jgi:hypothetical protein
MKSLFAAMCVLVAAGAAQAQQLEAGRWRVMTTQLGEGPVAAPPQIRMRCLTPAEVADPAKTFSPEVSTVNAICERTEYSLDQNFLKWRLQCRGQVDMDVAGQFIFESPTRYTAMVATKATVMERIVQSTLSTIDGQRVGDCAKEGE